MEMRQNTINWPPPLPFLFELAERLSYGSKIFKNILNFQMVVAAIIIVALQFGLLDESLKYYTESTKGLIWFYGIHIHYGIAITFHFTIGFLALFLITWFLSWLCHKNRLRKSRNKRLDEIINAYDNKQTVNF
jgi:hypothetical protein